MKLIFYSLLILSFSKLYSQNIDLKKLIQWRETNYKNVDKELLDLGWEKAFSSPPNDNYKSDKYFFNKGSNSEKVITLIYRYDYDLEYNTLSYSSMFDNSYEEFIRQIKSFGFKLFRSDYGENLKSEYYKSDIITLVSSIIKGVDYRMQEIEFFRIYLSTNQNYDVSR